MPPTAKSQDLVVQNTLAHSVEHSHEALLVKALDEIKRNRLDLALADLEHLVKINPNFKLAQLIYADLLLARSKPINDFGNLSYAPYENIVALRDEAKSRWRHYHSPIVAGQIPNSLIQLDDKQRFAIVVDLSMPRLYVFENRDGVPRLIKDFYVTIGKNGIGKYQEGDQRTPVGVYFVSDFIESKNLPDLYGEGAFPINYPNAWDRSNGHTGFGIWLHGTPSNTYSRPPRDSDGCVILSNQDFSALVPYMEIGRTPVILADTIKWISTGEWAQQQLKFEQFIEQWRHDWESRDTNLYLSHYSKGYSGLGNDYESWVNHKRRVNSAKEYIKVNISETSMFLYPNGVKILVVTFEQDYSSNTFKRRNRKRQYWQMETDGAWRIFYEGSISWLSSIAKKSD